MSDKRNDQILTGIESVKLWQMKAWAILFVICAHCAGVSQDAPMLSQIISRLLGSLGSLGVPIFFFCAGYVFRCKKLVCWLKEKTTGLLIPWLSCGILVYLYVQLRKGSVSLGSLVLWLVGDGSYLWYLSVLVLLWIWAWILMWGVQKGFWKYSIPMGISLLISAAALLLEHVGVLTFHPYLNVFRWIWFFAVGLLARRVSLLERLPAGWAGLPVWIIILGGLAAGNIAIYYWSPWFFLYAFVTIALAAISSGKEGKLSLYLKKAGEDSFAIYLLHMPVAGVISNLCNRIADLSGLLTLLRPFLILIITHGCIRLVKKLGQHFKCEKTFALLFGFR